MKRQFDRQEAKKFLLAREEKEKQQQEENRQKVLQHVISVLQKKFTGSEVQVYLVGSVLRAYHFNTTSDIDIVVRNFKGDRFQLYTALEDLFKQIAKSFENHIEKLETFHKELLKRMSIDMPKMRPQVLSTKSFLLLDKIRSFRHFIRHAYDCELDVEELRLIQQKMKQEFLLVFNDLQQFRGFVQELIEVP